MKFSCPYCLQHLEADDSFAGTIVNCPSCGKEFVVPVPPPENAVSPEAPAESPSPPVPPAEPPSEAQPNSSPPEPPKAKPKFRVVSRSPSSKKTTGQPPNPPSGTNGPHDGTQPPKTAPKFRVVSPPPSGKKSAGKSPNPPSEAAGEVHDAQQNVATNLRNRFNDFTGLEKLEGFSLSALFSEIFGKHKAEDIEEMFTVGTPRTTPPIEEVDTSWPRPWLFFRALAASVLLYLLFNAGLDYFNNLKFIPGMLLTGTLVVPLATLLFFYEINVRRNISLYQILRLFFLGGILSLLFSLVLFGVTSVIQRGLLADIAPGPIEETGKLLALILVARSMCYHYKLNGLLMGAAIGTGFEVFESMGYAFEDIIFASGDPIEAMKNSIVDRGVSASFAHIVWTAIAGAALWRVKGGKPFRFAMLGDGKFWHLFLIPVVLHALWDTHIPYIDNLPYQGKYLLLGFIAWFVVLALVQEGLKELRAEKMAAMREGNVGVEQEVAG